MQYIREINAFTDNRRFRGGGRERERETKGRMKSKDNAKTMREKGVKNVRERTCLSRNTTSTSHIMYGISDEPLVCSRTRCKRSQPCVPGAPDSF